MISLTYFSVLACQKKQNDAVGWLHICVCTVQYIHTYSPDYLYLCMYIQYIHAGWVTFSRLASWLWVGREKEEKEEKEKEKKGEEMEEKKKEKEEAEEKEEEERGAADLGFFLSGKRKCC